MGKSSLPHSTNGRGVKGVETAKQLEVAAELPLQLPRKAIEVDLRALDSGLPATSSGVDIGSCFDGSPSHAGHRVAQEDIPSSDQHFPSGRIGSSGRFPTGENSEAGQRPYYLGASLNVPHADWRIVGNAVELRDRIAGKVASNQVYENATALVQL